MTHTQRTISRLLMLAIVIPILGIANKVFAAVAADPPVQDVWRQILEASIPHIIALVSAALVLAIAWMRSKTKALIDQKVASGLAHEAMLWLNGAVWDVVQKAQQVSVERLKKDLEDGRITREEYEASMAKVKDAVIQEVLGRVLGKLQTSGVVETVEEARALIDTKVEAAVGSSKAAAPDPR